MQDNGVFLLFKNNTIILLFYKIIWLVWRIGCLRMITQRYHNHLKLGTWMLTFDLLKGKPTLNRLHFMHTGSVIVGRNINTLMYLLINSCPAWLKVDLCPEKALTVMIDFLLFLYLFRRDENTVKVPWWTKIYDESQILPGPFLKHLETACFYYFHNFMLRVYLNEAVPCAISGVLYT